MKKKGNPSPGFHIPKKGAEFKIDDRVFIVKEVNTSIKHGGNYFARLKVETNDCEILVHMTTTSPFDMD
jgi:hypothetical protein